MDLVILGLNHKTVPVAIRERFTMTPDATFNTSLDTLGRWNLNLRSNLGYHHDVGYVAVGKKSSERNVTRRNQHGDDNLNDLLLTHNDLTV